MVAQADAPVPWSALSPARREALAPLHGEWARLDPSQRLKWLEVADRFPSMSAESRARMQARMGEWTRMTPAERGTARQRFQEAQRIDPQERRARWQEYQSLSAEERQRWADRSSRESAASARPWPERATRVPPPGGVAPHALEDATIRPPAGATTTLIDQPRRERPGADGRPSIATSPALVDRDTLLPRSGPQGTTPRREGGTRHDRGDPR